jgi:hypothetical protein
MNNCYNNFKAPPRCLLLIIALQAIRIAHCTLHNAATLMQSFKADNATFNVREKSRKSEKSRKNIEGYIIVALSVLLGNRQNASRWLLSHFVIFLMGTRALVQNVSRGTFHSLFMSVPLYTNFNPCNTCHLNRVNTIGDYARTRRMSSGLVT